MKEGESWDMVIIPDRDVGIDGLMAVFGRFDKK